MKIKRKLILCLCLLLLVACDDSSKSGSEYEQKIVDELERRYEENFVIIDRKNFNSNGYQILLLSPEHNDNIIFHAFNEKTGNGTIPITLFRDNYEDISFLYFAPELYNQYAGTSIDRNQLINDYYNLNNYREQKYDVIPITLYESDLIGYGFLIDDINEQNLQEKSEQIYYILYGLSKVPPFNKFTPELKGNPFTYIPVRFSGAGDITIVELSLLYKEDSSAKETIYNYLLNEIKGKNNEE